MRTSFTVTVYYKCQDILLHWVHDTLVVLYCIVFEQGNRFIKIYKLLNLL